MASLRLGKFDLDEHFMAFDSAANLINSSFAALASVTVNQPIATYPLAGLGALAS